MNNGVKVKYGYVVHKQTKSDGGFLHIEIELIRFDGYDGKGIIRFRWQSEQKTKPEDRYWYGFSVSPELRNPDQLKEVFSLLKRVLPMDYHDWFSLPPATIIERCERRRIKRVIYDSRVHDYVKIADVPDPDLDQWMIVDPSSGRNTFSVLAHDEREAQELGLKEYADLVGSGNGYRLSPTMMAAWLEAEQPVKTTAAGMWPTQAPDIVDTEELLKLD